MPNIKLKSSDGEIFVVDYDIAKCSTTIKTMIDDLGLKEEEEECVPLPNVKSAILRKVIEWSTYHKEEASLDDNEENLSVGLRSWDADFLRVDQATLFELILAANYLDIKSLLKATCKNVANMITGKSPAEIRATFNIENDLTPDEEEDLKQQECLD